MTETTNFNPFAPFFLQRIVTGLQFTTFLFSPLTGWLLTIYLMTTRFWWLTLIYLIWFYIDRNTPQQGGRSISWIQYVFAPGFNLDPKRNYLFCYCPHGVIPGGSVVNLLSGASKLYKLYPNFKTSFAIIKCMFYTPFMRDWILGIGFTACTPKGISYILSRPEGGQILCLNTGGAAEAYYSQPGKYCTIIKNRKGFVKMALKHGTSLVPVITFGECDQFYHVDNEKFRIFQEFVRKICNLAPIMFYGTGFFFKYGMVPLKVPIRSVVGVPIDVAKIENPTDEQINQIHEKYVQQLVNLFETYKHQYLENPNTTNLILI